MIVTDKFTSGKEWDDRIALAISQNVISVNNQIESHIHMKTSNHKPPSRPPIDSTSVSSIDGDLLDSVHDGRVGLVDHQTRLSALDTRTTLVDKVGEHLIA
jgi:hypothetical protein